VSVLILMKGIGAHGYGRSELGYVSGRGGRGFLRDGDVRWVREIFVDVGDERGSIYSIHAISFRLAFIRHLPPLSLVLKLQRGMARFYRIYGHRLLTIPPRSGLHVASLGTPSLSSCSSSFIPTSLTLVMLPHHFLSSFNLFLSSCHL
jgi:hypothetical protein